MELQIYGRMLDKDKYLHPNPIKGQMTLLQSSQLSLRKHIGDQILETVKNFYNNPPRLCVNLVLAIKNQGHSHFVCLGLYSVGSHGNSIFDWGDDFESKSIPYGFPNSCMKNRRILRVETKLAVDNFLQDRGIFLDEIEGDIIHQEGSYVFAPGQASYFV